MKHSDEIDLRVYFAIMKKWFWWIALCVAAFTSLAAWYTTVNYVPLYQAQTKVIVNGAETDLFGRQVMNIGGGGIDSGLINTYKEIIRSPMIMDKVVQNNPNLEVSSKYLTQVVNVFPLNDTQVVVISATDYSYERAVLIANAVTAVFQAELPNISRSSNVVVLTGAEMTSSPQPINKQQNTYIIMAFMASLILSAGTAILYESLDDKLRTEEDIERKLGVRTLASIPKLKNHRRNVKKAEGGSYVAVKP